MVSGDLSDVCGDVDKSTNHWRDPVETKQPGTGAGKRISKNKEYFKLIIFD